MKSAISAEVKQEILEKVKQGEKVPDAVATYKEAIDAMINNPPENHNRPSFLANMQVHMATCEYKAGDKEALGRATQALRELEAAEEPSQHNKDVWVSGGYMRLADALRNDNPVQAKQYLEKTKLIIDANPELKLRKQQWEKLLSTFQ